MNQADAHVGMRVVFGRTDGEQTLGKVVRLSRARAKVKLLEQREGREAGTIWNVPYELMEPTDDKEAPAK